MRSNYLPLRFSPNPIFRQNDSRQLLCLSFDSMYLDWNVLLLLREKWIVNTNHFYFCSGHVRWIAAVSQDQRGKKNRVIEVLPKWRITQVCCGRRRGMNSAHSTETQSLSINYTILALSKQEDVLCFLVLWFGKRDTWCRLWYCWDAQHKTGAFQVRDTGLVMYDRGLAGRVGTLKTSTLFHCSILLNTVLLSVSCFACLSTFHFIHLEVKTNQIKRTKTATTSRWTPTNLKHWTKENSFNIGLKFTLTNEWLAFFFFLFFLVHL